MDTPTATDTTSEFAEKLIAMLVWKSPAMLAMAVAVCRLALARAGAEFSANDLDEFDHGGQGICGGTFHILKKEGFISKAGTFEGRKFTPKVVTNARGNLICVYRLKSSALCLALIK